MFDFMTYAPGFLKVISLVAEYDVGRHDYLYVSTTGTTWSRLYVSVMGTLLQSMAISYMTEEERMSVTCAPEASIYRQADGTCNNLAEPRIGSVGSPFGRNIPSPWETETPPGSYLWEPPVEKAASLLNALPGQPAKLTGFNMFFSIWIQFQIHDWFAHITDDEAEPYRLNTVGGDSDDGFESPPWWCSFWYEHDLCRSRADDYTFKVQPTKRDATGVMRSQTTHWWDMSMIYGSDVATRDSLRTFVGGKMKIDAAGLLPKDPSTQQMKTGFTSNLWTGLETLHTVYTKEHNWICDKLLELNPDFNDTKLFETARLINAAQNQVIHTNEWTRLLLYTVAPTPTNNTGFWGIDGMREKFSSVLDLLEPVVRNFTAVLDETRGSSRLGSGTASDRVGFSMTEDFVAVYRMHALMPDTLTVNGTTTSLLDHTFEGGRKKVEEYGISSFVEGFAKQQMPALTLHNYPRSFSTLRTGPNKVIDMAAVDIFRDRERGILRYNDFRQSLGMNRFATFEDINPDPAVAAELRAVYKSVDDIDLQVGMMAEEPRPGGFAISDTSFFIFLVQTARRTQSDRFFKEDFREEIYTAWGVEYATSAKFSRLFENNYPETTSAFGASSAFYPASV